MTVAVSLVSGNLFNEISLRVSTGESTGTQNRIAIVGEDYTATSAILTLDPDTSQQILQVEILDDELFEGPGDEEFMLSLSVTSGNAIILDQGRVTVTIVDDDIAFVSILSPVSPADFILTEDTASDGNTLTFVLGFEPDIQVRRSGESVEVRWMVECTEDVTPADFIGTGCPSGSLFFPNGAGSDSFTLEVMDDEDDEQDEEFTVLFSFSPSTLREVGDIVSLASTQVTVEIEDNDDVAVLTLNAPRELTEIDEDGTVSFTIGLADNLAAEESFTVGWGVICDDDLTPQDFQDTLCPSGEVTLNIGDTSETFSVTANDDSLIEGDETLRVALLSVSSGNVAISDTEREAVVTIRDDDTAELTISGSSEVLEGSSAEFFVIFPSDILADEDVRLDWNAECNDGNAVDADFGSACPSGTITIPEREQSGFFSVTVALDTLLEGDEVFILRVSTPSAETISDRLSISDEALNQGFRVVITDASETSVSTEASPRVISEDAGENTVFFRVSLQDASPTIDIPIMWSVNCTNGITPEDFNGSPCNPQSAVINAGEMNGTFQVIAADDTEIEGSELFTVNVEVELPSRTVTLTTPPVTIADNDTTATLFVRASRSRITEGDGVDFIVGIDGDVRVEEPVVVQWSIGCEDNPSINSNDFTSELCDSNEVSILSNQTMAVFTINTEDDTRGESDEVIRVTLTGLDAGILGERLSIGELSSAETIIEDNDEVILSLSASPTTVSENTSMNTASFTVSLSRESDEDISVEWSVSCNDDIKAADFTFGEVCPSGTVTIAASDTSTDFTLTVSDDLLVETDDEFTVILSNPRSIVALFSLSETQSGAIVTIEDNDADNVVVSLEFTDITIRESVSTDFRVVLDNDLITDVNISVRWGLEGCSEMASGFGAPDFNLGTCPSGDTVISRGASFAVLPIILFDDAWVENTENFVIVIENAEADGSSFDVSISQENSRTNVTVEDDDPPAVVTLQPSAGTISELNEGEVIFTVGFTDGNARAGEDVGVQWRIADCDADDVTAADFVSEEACGLSIVTIAAGTASAEFIVKARDDTLAENTETFTVELDSMLRGDLVPSNRVSLSADMRTAIVTLDDNDTVSLSLDASVDAISEAPNASVEFTVSFDGDVTADENVSFDWNVVCIDNITGTVSTEDLIGGACTARTLTIPAGSTSITFVVTTVDDDDAEGPETLEVLLSNPRSSENGLEVALSRSTASVIIIDDESLLVEVEPTLDDVAEGTQIMFTITLSDLPPNNISLPWEVRGCTEVGRGITAGDFADRCPSGEVNITSGAISTIVTLTVAADSLVEGSEMFNLVIPVEGRTLGTGFPLQRVVFASSLVTIADGDSAEVSFVEPLNDTVDEGSSGITFTVGFNSNDVRVDEDVFVRWSVECTDSLAALTSEDFIGFGGSCPSGETIIAAGNTKAVFVVTAAADMLVEGLESFIVTLDDTYTVFDALAPLTQDRETIATAEINDADSPAVLDIVLGEGEDLFISEGEEITLSAVLMVEGRRVTPDEDVSVRWEVECNGDITPADFGEVSCPGETVTIAANNPSASFVVSTVRDGVVEDQESFRVRFVEPVSSATLSLAIGDRTFSVTVRNEDTTRLQVEPSADMIDENDPAVFIVSLSGDVVADTAIDVTWSVDCSGDITSADFGGVCPSGTTRILAGQNSVEFEVMPVNDRLLEGIEIIEVIVNSPVFQDKAVSSLPLSDPNEERGEVSLAPEMASITEGSMTDTVTFTVDLIGVRFADEDIDVTWSVDCSGDITPADFGGICPSGTTRILAGQNSSTFTVTIADDNEAESMETFEVSLAEVSPEFDDFLTISDEDTARVTILDDEIVVGFDDPLTYDENEAVGLPLNVTVRLLTEFIAEGEVVTVSVMSNDITASEGLDYVAVFDVVTFTAEDTAPKVVRVSILDDTDREPIEEFTLNLSVENGVAAVDRSEVLVSITDNEVSVVGEDEIGFSFSSYIVDESEGFVDVEILAGTFTSDVTVALRTEDGTALNGRDYVATSAVLTFGRDRTSAVVSIEIIPDRLAESQEQFAVILSTDSPDASLATRRAAAIVRDDDAAVLSFEPLAENISEGGTAVFRVILEGGVVTSERITAEWNVECGTDTVNSMDFVGMICPSGTVVVESGMSSAAFTVISNDDRIIESDEQFVVTLQNPAVAGLAFDVNLTGGAALLTTAVTIRDNDAGRLSIINPPPSVQEDPEAGNTAQFRVNLDGGVIAGEDITLVWSVDCERGDRGRSGFASRADFAGGNCPEGTAIIEMGGTFTTFAVTTTDDTFSDPEVFDVTIRVEDQPGITFSMTDSSAVTLTLSLIDNDLASIRISSASNVPEGESLSLEFMVRSNDASMGDIVLPWRVECDENEVTGADFDIGVCPSGMVTIASGAVSATVSLNTASDALIEGDEVFTLVVPVQGRVLPSDFELQAVEFNSDFVTVTDATQSSLMVSAAPRNVREGQEVEFIITLSGENNPVPERNLDLLWNVICGSGTIEMDDFTRGDGFSGDVCAGSITIDAGISSTTLTLGIADDRMVEDPETFTLNVMPELQEFLSSPGVAVSPPVTISDVGTAMLSLEVSSTTLIEGAQLDLTLRLPSGVTANESIRVNWLVDCNGDITTDDFEGASCPSGISVIMPGFSTDDFTVTTLDDMLVEGDETFTVMLELLSGNAELSDNARSVTVAVQDVNSAELTLTPQRTSVSEGFTVNFDVSLAGNVTADEDIQVDWAVVCSGDVTDADFGQSCPSGSVTINAGSETATLAISTVDDMLVEGDEILIVGLDRPSDYTNGFMVDLPMNPVSVTINDINSAIVSLDVQEDSLSEGRSFNFTVSLIDGVTADEPITLDWAVDCIVNVTDADFGQSCPSGSVTIDEGTTTATFTFMTVEDMLVEGNEIVQLALALPGGIIQPSLDFDVTLMNPFQSLTVEDIDVAVLSVENPPLSIEEGESAVFIVNLIGGVTADEDITLEWEVDCTGIGIVSEDFENNICPNGSAPITAGSTSITFSFVTVDDEVMEGLKRLPVTISAPEGVTFDTTNTDRFTHVVTLLDNEAISVQVDLLNTSVSEGEELQFTLVLSRPIAELVELPWRIDCSSPLTPSDFVGAEECPSGIVTIPTDELVSPIQTVTLITDDLVEGNEPFRISVPTAARTTSDLFTIQDFEFTSDLITVLDITESELSVSASTQTAAEGERVEFTVSLSGDVRAGRDLVFAVSCGGEVNEEDFADDCTGEVSIPTGQNSAILTLTLSVDSVVEGSEMFSLTVTPTDPVSDELVISPTAVVSSIVTITDGDAAVLSLTTVSPTVSEGDTATFIVNLSGVTVDERIDVTWSVSCEGDITEADFTGTPSPCVVNTLSIPAGTLSYEFTVSVSADMLAEGEEMFDVTLTDVSPNIENSISISASSSSASVTISDGDATTLSFTVDSPEVSEGSEATFTVSLPEGIMASNNIPVAWSVSCEGDITPRDFVGDICPFGEAPSGVAMIEEGSVSDTFVVPVRSDLLVEGNENFTVTLNVSTSSFVTLLNPSQTVEIVDGDRAEISSARCDFVEGDSPEDREFRFIAYLDNGRVTSTQLCDSVYEGIPISMNFLQNNAVRADEDISVDWSVDCEDSGPGVTSSDFSGTPCDANTITLAANTLPTVVTFSISTVRDMLAELPMEEFEVTFSNPRAEQNGFGVELPMRRPDTENIQNSDKPMLSFDSPEFVDEDPTGMSTAIITVSLLPAGVTADGSIFLFWNVSCEGDVTPSDFTGTPSPCTATGFEIPTGATHTTFSFTTADDGITEDSVEEIRVIVGSALMRNRILFNLPGDRVIVGLRDDESLSIGVVPDPAAADTLLEGDALTFRLTLSDEVNVDVILPWSVNCDLGATDAADFDGSACPQDSVTIRSGDRTSSPITVTAAVDTLLEGDEIFRVIVLGGDIMAAGSTNLPLPAEDLEFFSDVTIRDRTSNALSVTVNTLSATANTLSANEGEAFEFTVSLSGDVTAGRDLVFAVSCEGEVNEDDFVDGCRGEVSIPIGENSGVLTLTAAADNLVESVEEFSLIVTPSDPTSEELLLPSHVAVSQTVAISEVLISETEVLLSGPDSVDESPTDGMNVAIFTVSLERDLRTSEPITVTWSVSCEGDITTSDFMGTPSPCDENSVIIPAGSSSVTFAVLTADDSVVEGNEDLRVTLRSVSAPGNLAGRVNIPATDNSAVVMLRDNDSVVLSILGPISVYEDETDGSNEASFTVNLSGGTVDEDIAVTWSVSCEGDVTASDFTGTPSPCDVNTLMIPANALSAEFIVSVSADMLAEGEETFGVTLTGDVSPPNIDDSISISPDIDLNTASVLIRDGDSAVLSLTVDSPTVSEGGSATFTVTLGDGVRADENIAVDWSVACDGDVSDEDFVGGCPSGTATITADTSSDEFTVSVSEDMLAEGEETFIVTLSDPRAENGGFSVSLADTSASVNIEDNEDEALLLVSVNPVNLIVDEDEDGMNTARFRVDLYGGVRADEDITLEWSVDCELGDGGQSGFASSSDFTGRRCPEGIVTLDALGTSADFSFTTLDDPQPEGGERFTVSITATTDGNFGVAFLDTTSVDTVGDFIRELILIDDEAISLEVNAVDPVGSEGGMVTFRINFTQPVAESLMLPWRVDCNADGVTVTPLRL